MEQVKVLNEYYTNLNYNIDKEKALKEIYNLSETVKFEGNVTFLRRLEIIEDIIKENILYFKAVCHHVDIIYIILQYLNNHSIYMQIAEKSEDCYTLEFMPALLTFFNICKENAIQSFLLNTILNDPRNFNIIYPYLQKWFHSIKLEFSYTSTHAEHLYTEREMIILQDSDLYSVIYYLTITTDNPLNKIWVQEQVKEKFLWVMKRHSLNSFTIDTFQSLKDIQFHLYHESGIINIMSIWSEDIIAAKNLAMSLHGQIIFINTYMDFLGVNAHIPYPEAITQAINELNLKEIKKNISNSDIEETDITEEKSVNEVHFSNIGEMNFTSIYKLYYDGTWQEPVKGMYWKHDDNLWANATNNDIIRCYESAKKGFKIWSIKPIKTKIQILSRLMSMLKFNGKLILAAIVARWLTFPYLIDRAEGHLEPNRMVETVQVRVPVGVIILREEKENVLFFRLMQALIAGNSVIVMFGPNFCNLTPYCDIFLTCGIPPGVINLLSHENPSILEHKLCTEKYAKYADDIFLKGKDAIDTYILPYKNLTVSKIIILYLKRFS